jgi:hypothetical protein
MDRVSTAIPGDGHDRLDFFRQLQKAESKHRGENQNVKVVKNGRHGRQHGAERQIGAAAANDGFQWQGQRTARKQIENKLNAHPEHVNLEKPQKSLLPVIRSDGQFADEKVQGNQNKRGNGQKRYVEIKKMDEPAAPVSQGRLRGQHGARHRLEMPDDDQHNADGSYDVDSRIPCLIRHGFFLPFLSCVDGPISGFRPKTAAV